MIIAGHFTATFGPANTPIGTTESGFRIHEARHHQRVSDDAYGDAMPDAVNQGSDISVSLTWIEYDLVVAAMQTFNTQGGTTPGSGVLPSLPYFTGSVNNQVGQLISTQSAALILTPVQHTPWANYLGAKTWQFPLASVATDIEWLLASKYTKGPITFTCLPTSKSAGTGRAWICQ